jgi:excisionase family DNA binding protein
MILLNTAQVAERLGISVRRVRALIAEGTLKAHQLGREYAIEESALASVTVYGKAGRPPKETGEAANTGQTERAITAKTSEPRSMKPSTIMRMLRKHRPDVYGAGSDEDFQSLLKMAKAEERKSAKTAKAGKKRTTKKAAKKKGARAK